MEILWKRIIPAEFWAKFLASNRSFKNVYGNSKPQYLITLKIIYRLWCQNKKLSCNTCLSFRANLIASSCENSSSPSSSIISSICSFVSFATSLSLRALMTLLRLSSTEPFHFSTSITAKILLHRTSSYTKLFCLTQIHFWSILSF